MVSFYTIYSKKGVKIPKESINFESVRKIA